MLNREVYATKHILYSLSSFTPFYTKIVKTVWLKKKERKKETVFIHPTRRQVYAARHFGIWGMTYYKVILLADALKRNVRKKKAHRQFDKVWRLLCDQRPRAGTRLFSLLSLLLFTTLGHI